MTKTRAGYWDIDRCAWVGADPTYVVPPAPRDEHVGERRAEGGEATESVPSPRTGKEEPASNPTT